ncbi:Uncharacterised protein [Collinsella intestinalis]|nr:Uncharacterised protein [Collinsella intestinalis]
MYFSLTLSASIKTANLSSEVVSNILSFQAIRTQRPRSHMGGRGRISAASDSHCYSWGLFGMSGFSRVRRLMNSSPVMVSFL